MLNLLLATALALSWAASVRAEGTEINLRVGKDGGDFEGAGIGVRFGPQWSREMGNWKATLRPELEFNHFRYTGSAGGPGNLNELGGQGLFRFQRAVGLVRPYAEAGLGIAYFSRNRLGDKDFSTRYQFTEQVGLGVDIGDRWFVGWRYSHYSNADIKKPNDGLDLHQLLVGFRF